MVELDDGNGVRLPDEQAAAQKSNFLSRLMHIHTAPERAFRAVIAQPGTWWQPVLLLALLGAGIIWFTMDDLIMPAMREGMLERDVAEDQIDGALPILRLVTWASLLLVPLRMVVIALVGHLSATLVLGGTGRYVMALAVISYAHLVGVVETIVRVPLMLLKQSIEVHLGPVLLLPVEMQETFVYRALAQFDVFAIWKVLLMGLGLGLAYGLVPRRTIILMVALWLVWVLATSALGGLAGGMGS